MEKKMAYCIHCASGNTPKEFAGQYEHWVVTSILRPRIKVVPCKALKVHEITEPSAVERLNATDSHRRAAVALRKPETAGESGT